MMLVYPSNPAASTFYFTCFTSYFTALTKLLTQVCMMVVYPSNPAGSPCFQQPLADSDEQVLADVECGGKKNIKKKLKN